MHLFSSREDLNDVVRREKLELKKKSLTVEYTGQVQTKIPRYLG